MNFNLFINQFLSVYFRFTSEHWSNERYKQIELHGVN